jgi:chemotaxis protein MotB
MNEPFDDSAEEEPFEDWLVTYADAIMPLMAFFVIMFAISEPSQEIFEEVTDGIRERLTGEQEAMPLQDVRQQMTAVSKAAGEQTQVKSGGPGVTFDFKSGKMFAPGSVDILLDAVPTPDGVA